MFSFNIKYKYKYNSYFYCAPYSLTDGALQKSASMYFIASSEFIRLYPVSRIIDTQRRFSNLNKFYNRFLLV